MSFDCEGNWGRAERVAATRRRPFSNTELTATTGEIVQLLDSLGLRATFAIVGAYMISFERFTHMCAAMPGLRRAAVTEAFESDWRRGNLDGWFNPHIMQTIGERHEIAGHGFSHRRLGPDVPGDVVSAELGALAVLEPFRNREWTFVYPYNVIGQADRLSEHGVIGFRNSPIQNPLRRIANMARGPSIEPYGAETAGVTAVPGGDFLYWRAGFRKLLPARLVEAQWKTTLERLVEEGGVVHLWSHPENFITGPSGFRVLRNFLSDAAELVRAGYISNPTMIEYCRHGDRGRRGEWRTQEDSNL